MKALRICAGTAAVTATFSALAAGAQASTFSNGHPIGIPPVGVVNPYPSTLSVSGMPSVLQRMQVTIRGISHGFPRDVDILLVGPDGKNTILMSDACDQTPTDLVNATLTIDDFAARPMPDVTPDAAPACPSGTYQTTDWEFENPAEMPPPAPAKTGPANLSVFNGTNPNGTWSLYVADDAPPFIFPEPPAGIAGGWSLELLPLSSCLGKRPAAPAHVGTDGRDVLTGTPGADVMVGFGGNDVIKGLGGRDRICGGTGNDKLFGGGGIDILLGQKGQNKLNGQKGRRDICVGGPRRDRVKSCELIAKI